MYSKIDHRSPSCPGTIGKPTVNSSRSPSCSHPHRFREVNFTKPPFTNRLPGSLHRTGKAHLPAKKINQSSLLSFSVQLPHLLCVQCWRLFAQDMLSSLQCLQCSREMKRVRQTDDNSLEVRIRQHLFVAAEDLFRRIPCGKLFPPFSLRSHAAYKCPSPLCWIPSACRLPGQPSPTMPTLFLSIARRKEKAKEDGMQTPTWREALKNSSTQALEKNKSSRSEFRIATFLSP